MKLFPPQKEFRIYDEGFQDNDILNRQEVGKRLSDLVDKIDDPIVIALDGPWGSGKSFFLKRWVGAHKRQNNGVATTVYFDAFANDFLDDPLIALTGAIGERLDSKGARVGWKKVRSAAAWLARPVLRVGAAVATAGASEVAGPVMDAALNKLGKEADDAVDAFWKREHGRKAAMQQFSDALAKLTAPAGTGDGPAIPLVVVIDELDRCRPDYALSVLEVIKHFFSVPRVHFVLGINMDAMEHIVRTRYGAGVDASDYLKRFISISMKLPKFTDKTNEKLAQIAYFSSAASAMGIEQALRSEVLEKLKLCAEASNVSLRDIERILSRLVLLPGGNELASHTFGLRAIVITLLLFQVIRPEFYRKAVAGKITIDEVRDFFGITPTMILRELRRGGTYNHDAYILNGLWLFVLSQGEEPREENDQFRSAFSSYRYSDKGFLAFIDRVFFGVFDPSFAE